jgi:hypothetical protein
MTPPHNAEQISWSLGETAALATKAARGAGMPWGLADETGEAVSWLQARGMPGLAALCRYLKWRGIGSLARWPDCPTSGAFYCPIALGTAYMDGALSAELTIENIREPLLLLPFIAKRNDNQTMQVIFGNMSIHLSNSDVFSPYLDTTLLINQANCTVKNADNPPGMKPFEFADRVPSHFFGCVKALDEFAKKTYAPATERSRLAGAGAGLNDND